MKIKLTILFMLVLANLGFSESTSSGLTTRSEIEWCGGKAFLKIYLHNQGNSEVEILNGTLPWKSDSSIQIYAILDSGGYPASLLKKRTIIDDPEPGIITLAPNEIISGKVPLSDVFPKLNSETEKNKIHCFWRFQILRFGQAENPIGFVGYEMIQR